MASHGASVAISPVEMYQFVFALVEDEMSGDPSYLVSVIIEFLRRYVSFTCYSYLLSLFKRVLLPQLFVPMLLQIFMCFYFTFPSLSNNSISWFCSPS